VKYMYGFEIYDYFLVPMSKKNQLDFKSLEYFTSESAPLSTPGQVKLINS